MRNCLRVTEPPGQTWMRRHGRGVIVPAVLCVLAISSGATPVSAVGRGDAAEDKKGAPAKTQERHLELREELKAMADADQAVRKKATAAKGKPEPEVIDTMMHVDRRNTARMHEIVDTYGWPTKTLVGAKASHEAWLLVQHADHDVEFQQRCLKLVTAHLRDGETTKTEFAYLTDRVLVNTGKP